MSEYNGCPKVQTELLGHLWVNQMSIKMCYLFQWVLFMLLCVIWPSYKYNYVVLKIVCGSFLHKWKTILNHVFEFTNITLTVAVSFLAIYIFAESSFILNVNYWMFNVYIDLVNWLHTHTVKPLFRCHFLYPSESAPQRQVSLCIVPQHVEDGTQIWENCLG